MSADQSATVDGADHLGWCRMPAVCRIANLFDVTAALLWQDGFTGKLLSVWGFTNDFAKVDYAQLELPAQPQ